MDKYWSLSIKKKLAHTKFFPPYTLVEYIDQLASGFSLPKWFTIKLGMYEM